MALGLPGPDVRLEKVRRATAATCRCGARIPPGAERIEVSGPPPSVDWLLEDRGFCSKGCVRAFMLEALAQLDGLSVPGAERTVTDLRATYLDLSRAFEEMRFDLTVP